MTSDERLAVLYGALRSLGLQVLVLGGQAVRFYGVDRSTLDYDFHVLVDDQTWALLGETLGRAPLLQHAGIVEGPSWRPAQFRRFVVGALPDGREERLEIWRRNHLLAPFDDLWRRRSEAVVAGQVVGFLGLDDLIRSKETEREDDWRDVALLEEIVDERRLSAARGLGAEVEAVSRLRSRRGYERAERAGWLASAESTTEAWRRSRHPISLAFLAPAAGSLPTPAFEPRTRGVDDLLDGPLRRVAPGSARHYALVEAVRRLYRGHAVAVDRADKERAAHAAE